MITETYQLELITPCFCGGAEPNKQAEIRVPSIRGQLRWWFRALGGPRKDEMELFGSAAGNRGRSSLALFRVFSEQAMIGSENLEDYTGLRGNDALSHAESYFLWPLRPYNDRITGEHRPQKRGNLRPATGKKHVSFTLEVRWRTNPPTEMKARFDSAISLWILLGSLGTRSLKGYGSVWPAYSVALAQDDLIAKLNAMPPRSVFLWKSGFGTPTDALRFAASEIKRLRCGTNRFPPLSASQWGQNDHDAGSLTPGPKPRSVFRPVLGLPLKQTFRGSSHTVETCWRDVSRFASPLHIKIGYLDTGHCVLLIFFDHRALPDGTALNLRDGQGTRSVTLDWGLWNHLKAVGTCLH